MTGERTVPGERLGRLAAERELFEALLRPELSGLYRLAGYLLCDADAAEDAAQEAVLRAWQAFPSLRDQGQFRPWLQRIAANVCRDLGRRRRVVKFVPLAGGADEPLASDPFRASLDRVAIGRAVAGLSPEHREVVVLRYLLDLSNEEIAERLAVPTGTVKSRLHYAFAALRRSLDRDGEVAR
jgi:RNA polymerase sigma-70 factor (ECF subfamily)